MQLSALLLLFVALFRTHGLYDLAGSRARAVLDVYEKPNTPKSRSLLIAEQLRRHL